MFILVVGCGRLGSYLANRLSEHGHSVVAIDRDEAAFEALSPEFSGFRLEGDATEFAVLREADIGNADMVVVTTHNDNINLLVSQVAKRLFGVERVIARVYEPERERTYRDLGIDTVCPVTSVAREILAGLT
ncbi:MAG: TrkA family potassium uptake protein [Armatimonadetes bacterium]|nr:TrkA family potassium uptake protein [Armatimonadota bacterium]